MPRQFRARAVFVLLLATSLAALPAHGQQGTKQEPQQKPVAPPPQQPPPRGGAATGGVFAPVRDALKRPITAGGLVDGAPVVFQDVTKEAGLAGWRNRSGAPQKSFIIEVATGGVALFDYDNDGWLDIYLVNGSTLDVLRGKEAPPHAALFHNNRDGTFTDVTSKAGVANERWGFGVAVGDFNNDGWPDLYVTNFGKNRLYRNNGDGTFTDVAEQAGVAVSGATNIWTTAAAFGDYDRDGRLDLFIAGYVKWDIDNPPAPGSAVVAGNYCEYRGQRVMCGPRGLAGERDFLFHNNGDGTFTEVAEKAGVLDPKGYYGFAAAWADVNDDGWPDLLVANDSTPNFLYLNRHDGTFEDVSYPSGFALNENGREQASMGIAVGDYNHDGRLDLYVTNFSDDYNTLYRNEGDANFTDLTFQVGLGEQTIPFLGWGTMFLDYDNDGHPDLFVANGHVYPEVDRNDWGTTWKQRPLLFRNLKGERFELVPPATGSGLAVLASARGAAAGDLDNDGRVDVVLNNLDGPPTVLRNVTPSKNNWVSLKLAGSGKSPRDAIGATVFLTAGGIRQRGEVMSGSSFCSQNDLRVHFGLGTATQVDALEIRWPDGAQESVKLPGINRIVTIVQGKGVVESAAQARKADEKKK
ncbi:MAG: CRTAC1 family protein [Acidobacteria bacterium]|nr:CRTAC1 family protein [Acidobacteriota bacterium]